MNPTEPSRESPAKPSGRRRFSQASSGFATGADSNAVIALELPIATLVWGGIGWLVDTYLLHTSPWLMIAGFGLGFCLGMYLLYLRLQASAEDGERHRSR